jgi:putative ABC transport system permease protein
MLAVGVGFAAINIFGGFTDYIFTNLRESFIYVEGNGHLSIFKSGAHDQDRSEDPIQTLLKNEEISQIRAAVEAQSNVLAVAEVMTLNGMISNGDTSTIFVGLARVPSEHQQFKSYARGLMARLSFFEGQPLQDELEYGIGIAQGLRGKLGIEIGSPAILMAPTVYGQINALDAEIRQIPDAPMELLEDKWVVMPLTLAQTLYDFDGASRINLLLSDANNLEQTRSNLATILRADGLAIDVHIWRELSPFYVKVEGMFRVLFLFIFLIVSVIIVMSVVNTVSMAVLERSREIGTLRAIGTKRHRVVSLFSLEGALLGISGCGLGVLLFAATLMILSILELSWTPPQISRSIPLEVYVVPEYLGLSMTLLTVLSCAAGIFPARRVARRNIVEALGHV